MQVKILAKDFPNPTRQTPLDHKLVFFQVHWQVLRKLHFLSNMTSLGALEPNINAAIQTRWASPKHMN